MPDVIPSAQQAKFTRMNAVLEQAFVKAEAMVNGEQPDDLATIIGVERYALFTNLGAMPHAARGIAITLAAYKICEPAQNTTAHKAEHPGGFAARSFDSNVTIPFLIAHSLPRNVETHWLTQTFSFAGPFTKELVLKTSPKNAGPMLVNASDFINESDPEHVSAFLTLLLKKLIEERNRNKVVITRPKNLPIEIITQLIQSHLGISYRANAPRLPQLVIYAIYMSLVKNVTRFHDSTLDPLERMKSADRKSGTVGDIVVRTSGSPTEAVEIKFNQEIEFIHVCEAIEKVRAESVRRYYILSTKDILASDKDRINEKKQEFLKQNGCEIIINGVIHSLSYYLRLLPDTTDFLFNYAGLLEADEDVTYEHKIAWNTCCSSI